MRDNQSSGRINIANIPVGSSLGAAVLIAVLLTAMFLELPGIRGVVMWGAAAGVTFGVALILWKRFR